ncbi:hypothetical protein TNCV_432221 [Trichonephila clavipes]|nr:hypothetical protein TNCV_432221 [Trichonephila clavipes]
MDECSEQCWQPCKPSSVTILQHMENILDDPITTKTHYLYISIKITSGIYSVRRMSLIPHHRRLHLQSFRLRVLRAMHQYGVVFSDELRFWLPVNSRHDSMTVQRYEVKLLQPLTLPHLWDGQSLLPSG